MLQRGRYFHLIDGAPAGPGPGGIKLQSAVTRGLSEHNTRCHPTIGKAKILCLAGPEQRVRLIEHNLRLNSSPHYGGLEKEHAQTWAKESVSQTRKYLIFVVVVNAVL